MLDDSTSLHVARQVISDSASSFEAPNQTSINTQNKQKKPVALSGRLCCFSILMIWLGDGDVAKLRDDERSGEGRGASFATERVEPRRHQTLMF